MCSFRHSPKLVLLSCDAERPILKLSIYTLGENMTDKYFYKKKKKTKQILNIIACGISLNSLFIPEVCFKTSLIKMLDVFILYLLFKRHQVDPIVL